MHLKCLMTLALIGQAVAAPGMTPNLMNEKREPFALLQKREPCRPGQVLVFETKSMHLCLGVYGVILSGTIVVGYAASWIISAFKGSGCTPAIGDLPIPGSGDSGKEVVATAPSTALQPRQTADATDKGVSIGTFMKYRWEKSGRNQCSTTLKEDDLESGLNNYALPWMVDHNRGCAVFELDNSGTFRGVLKFAVCKSASDCYDDCW